VTDLFEKLAAPFPPDRVSWRVGSVKKDGTAAMALAYIDARDVMERLDAVCGPENWERRHPHVDKTTTCEIAIWIEGRGWVVKSDGAGDTAVEAEKGSLSDSFKRAAVNWGVGRYLYDLPTPWVRIDQYKKILPEEETKLRKLLESRGPKPPPSEPISDYDPEPPLGSVRLSAFEAKRQGIGESIKSFIDGASAKELDQWEKNFDRNTGHVPASWLPMIRERIQQRREELSGEASVAEEVGEMDETFRLTMGLQRGSELAGRDGSRDRAVA
jgi:hypothetical protein